MQGSLVAGNNTRAFRDSVLIEETAVERYLAIEFDKERVVCGLAIHTLDPIDMLSFLHVGTTLISTQDMTMTQNREQVFTALTKEK